MFTNIQLQGALRDLQGPQPGHWRRSLRGNLYRCFYPHRDTVFSTKDGRYSWVRNDQREASTRFSRDQFETEAEAVADLLATFEGEVK